MTTRWPIHPAPTPGEALSSWLQRIAEKYGIELRDLVFDLGYTLDSSEDIDLAVPSAFIDELTERTGVSTEQIRAMSINGYAPWLVEHIEPLSNGFSTYTRQLAVLLPRRRRRDRAVPTWRAWIPATPKPQRRACPQCVLESPPPNPYPLMWSLPLMLSCPFHHCLLELHDGAPGYYFGWYGPPHAPEPRAAGPAVQAMDRRTWHALTTGSVDLPRHSIHAGLWFRLLRTLVDELGTPVSDIGTAQRLTRQVWKEAGHPVRAGQGKWLPYEQMPLTVQQHTLEAAAIAIADLEKGTLRGRGHEAALFRPEPNRAIGPGPPELEETVGKPSIEDLWQTFADRFNEALEEAKRDPASARQLLFLITYYRRNDEAFIRRAQADLAELGIPLEFLSQ
ncbi:MAG TPA: TniQ family protein [Arthrobacter sp.]|nr:TniQ family protein [Arthrobacter sp.]